MFDLWIPAAVTGCFFGLWMLLRFPRISTLGESAVEPRHRCLRSFAREEEGASATLDFLLAFPFFVMILLIVVQLALMINARLVVQYASYAAARSAIVWLDEGHDEALERSSMAAAIGCLPISPASAFWLDGISSLPTAAPLLLHDSASLVNPRRIWRAARKLAYSEAVTEVTLEGSEAGDAWGAKDPVTATVSHRFALTVPYASTLFATTAGGYFRRTPSLVIEGSSTLLNEGRIENR